MTREFEVYLECGLLEHGFVQLACEGCGEELLVAFSCKRRGLCPSCVGRRMSDVAAHRVDEVFPEEVAVRQWVCSLPWGLRYVLGYDRALCAGVLRAFIDALEPCLRRRAKREFSLRSVSEAHVGAVTVVQRSDSALRLNVHFHTLASDAVWVRDANGELSFRELPPPTADEVAEVASRAHQELMRVLAGKGRVLKGIDDAPDRLADEQPDLGGTVHRISDTLFGCPYRPTPLDPARCRPTARSTL